MTEIEFSWGTVSHKTDSETGDTNVEITLEAEGGVSLSVTTATDVADEAATTEPRAETTTFPWGAVTHGTDPDTGATNVEVITDVEADVSVSATAVSDGTTRSESTTVVRSTGDAHASVTRSVSSGTNSAADSVVATSSTTSDSQSTSVSSGTSIPIDDGDDD
ncbi:hypothetical protein [Natronorubrum halophilum]|uniref:hypothetical protein n=1 Tax=Natronorubrum halophilum TaxID=1702106 RepID=UPI000EF6A270|nr:hypothetical protein [Natronorubrum halophilum]